MTSHARVGTAELHGFLHTKETGAATAATSDPSCMKYRVFRKDGPNLKSLPFEMGSIFLKHPVLLTPLKMVRTRG